MCLKGSQRTNQRTSPPTWGQTLERAMSTHSVDVAQSSLQNRWTLERFTSSGDTTRRSTPVRDETCHTVRRQEIHRRRWPISPSDGTHFFDAAGEENDSKNKQCLGNSDTQIEDVFIQELGTSLSFHRRFYLQKDWSTRWDIHTCGTMDRIPSYDEGDASFHAVSTISFFWWQSRAEIRILHSAEKTTEC